MNQAPGRNERERLAEFTALTGTPLRPHNPHFCQEITSPYDRTRHLRHNRYHLSASAALNEISVIEQRIDSVARRKLWRVTHRCCRCEADTPSGSNSPINSGVTTQVQVSGFVFRVSGDLPNEVYDLDDRVHGRRCVDQLGSGRTVQLPQRRSVLLRTGCGRVCSKGEELCRSLCSGVCAEG